MLLRATESTLLEDEVHTNIVHVHPIVAIVVSHRGLQQDLTLIHQRRVRDWRRRKGDVVLGRNLAHLKGLRRGRELFAEIGGGLIQVGLEGLDLRRTQGELQRCGLEQLQGPVLIGLRLGIGSGSFLFM